ncbi:MAG: hypothetical protein KKD38_09185 [Candidatus Delongbacteria bacterium]|nr:hypothetical protein [Candidatus Delongbacteria bacterium]MCG2761075.1 hypothetical protein [Candidatus Delongbacteria bacterium]
MKKSIIVVIIFALFVLNAKMEEYDRKSISVFKLDVLDAAKMAANQDIDQIYEMIFDKFVGMGRFDYNPIPAGVTDPAMLFEIVKEYTSTKIEERAAKQWDIKNEYYGTNFVTGENVDKIISGAYIFFPTLETYVIAKKKDSDDFTVALSVILEVYSATNTGTVEAPVWEPLLISTVSAKGSNAFGNLFDIDLLKDKKKDKRVEAVKSATNGMLLFLEKEVRKLDVFKIKALVTKAEPKKDEISFNFGKNVGINMDDAYTVGYFEKDASGSEKYVETGFMKVRKIKDQESVSQLLIVTNPKRQKEEELYNEYDQCYEYPLVGLNIFINGGANSFKFWGDTDYTAGDTELVEENVNGFVGINLEYDVAKFVKIPELYLNVSADLLTAQLGSITDDYGTDEFETSSVIAEFGITKKFFKRQFGWYIGGDIGYLAMTSKSDNFQDLDGDFYSVGGKVKAGINYMINKNLLFDAGAGFRFYGELLNENGDEVSELIDTKYETEYAGEGWLTPSGFVFRVGLGYTL